MTLSPRPSSGWVTTCASRAAVATQFVRARQFAAVAAAARDRVDLGLRFTDPPASGRLQSSNGPGQATHKIALRSVTDVDDEVLHLVRLAYDQNG